MTNSTPKMNNKVERHSPRWSGKKRSSPSAGQQQRKSAAPISIPGRTQSSNRWMSSSPSSVSSCGGWSPKNQKDSPMCKNTKRHYSSPAGSLSSRNDSPRSSPTNNSFYAGAKFAEPPSPLTLPKPPMHWTGTDCAMQQMDCPFTAHLKMILKVQA